MEDDEEPKKATKEDELFGFPVSRLGALLGAGALLGVIALGAHILKPQLPNLMPNQAAQQQQIAQQQMVQQQQQQEQIAQQQQQPQPEQQPVAYGYATEHDPMSGKVTRTRVREIESDQEGHQFTNISV